MDGNLDVVKHVCKTCSSCATLTAAQQFTATFLEKPLADDGNAAEDAYEETLRPYHSTAQAIAFRMGMSFMPDKQAILHNHALAPGVDEDKLPEILERDAARVVKTLNPMIAWMLGKF